MVGEHPLSTRRELSPGLSGNRIGVKQARDLLGQLFGGAPDLELNLIAGIDTSAPANLRGKVDEPTISGFAPVFEVSSTH
jgi:hypothetical protein